MPFGDPMVLVGAAKAALDSITRNLAAIYGPQKGITVNSIGVGSTDTEAVRKAMSQWGEEYTQMAINFSPLKRLGSPEEVANVVSFVASPEASWINGRYTRQLFAFCVLTKRVQGTKFLPMEAHCLLSRADPVVQRRRP